MSKVGSIPLPQPTTIDDENLSIEIDEELYHRLERIISGYNTNLNKTRKRTNVVKIYKPDFILPPPS
jgi:preprotein translocase subunit SecA